MLKDPVRFRRLLAVGSLVLAPVLMVAGVLVAPFEETSTNAAYLDVVRDNPAAAELSAVLLHFGFLLLVPCVWAMASLLQERATVLGNLGLLLGTLGAIGNSGVVLLDFADIALVRELAQADAVAVYNRIDSSWGFGLSAILGIPLLGIGLMLLIAGLWRAAILPIWSLAVIPAALLAGTVLPVGRWSPLVLFGAVSVILLQAAFAYHRREPSREPAPAV
ncbi:MAG: hypothetical protein ACR2GT_13335 [Gaiellaceae bacterium]